MDGFKEYLSKPKKEQLIIVIAGVIFLGVSVLVFRKVGYLIGAVAALGGLACLYGGLTAGRRDAKNFERLEDEGKLSTAIADFYQSVPFMDGAVRFGDHYIFKRGDSAIIPYSEITCVSYSHSFDHSTDHGRSEYHVAVGYKKTPTNALYFCQHDHREQADEMIRTILQHNPAVSVKK